MAPLVLTANPARLWRQWRRHPDRWWHRASAGLLCLTVAQAAGFGDGRQVVSLLIGVVCGGGALSPDVGDHRRRPAYRRAPTRRHHPCR